MHLAGYKIRSWREAHNPPLSAVEFGVQYGDPWPSRTVYGWESKGKIARARIGDLPGFGQPTVHHVEQVRLATFGQGLIKLIGHIEMVFDGVLAASSDEYELFDAGGSRFFNRILY